MNPDPNCVCGRPKSMHGNHWFGPMVCLSPDPTNTCIEFKEATVTPAIALRRIRILVTQHRTEDNPTRPRQHVTVPIEVLETVVRAVDDTASILSAMSEAMRTTTKELNDLWEKDDDQDDANVDR